MPTSSYMPDVVVKLAFGSGFSTPAVDYVWTDVSTYAELHYGLTISGGRSDERSVADANQLSLTLDNRDGRFTPGRVTGAYYPDVNLDVPILVTADPVDGSASERFLGYVNEWPNEWEGTDGYAKVTLSASSRLSRLGLTSSLRSLIETEYLADDPIVYYPLGEPEGSTSAADVSGNSANPLAMVGSGTAVVFGTATGPGTDDLTAATFAGGKWLTVTPTAATYTDLTYECFVLAVAPPAATVTLVQSGDGATGLALGNTGQVVGLGGALGGANLCDGHTHHVAATYDGTNVRLYVDGVLDNTAATGIVTLTSLLVGGNAVTGTGVLTGTLAHVAVYDTELDAARIAAHAAAGDDGFAGDLTDARLERYATYAAIPAAEVDAETGSTTMSHVDTTDQSVVDLMRVVETTEGGVLYDERDGTLTFHNRAHRYTATSLFTLDMAKGEVESDYAPRLDRSALLNDVSAQNIAGTYSARKRVATNYGEATDSVTTASENPDEPLQIVSWRTGVYSEPRVRVPSLSVDCLAQVGKTVTCADVMATTVGDKLTVSNQPSQSAVAQVDYFVEGWTETYGPESLVMTFNVSPSSPWDQTLILGDATRGFLGVNPLAY